MSNVELKPCPFCGGKAVLFHISCNSIEELDDHPGWVWNNPVFLFGYAMHLIVNWRILWNSKLLQMMIQAKKKRWKRCNLGKTEKYPEGF